MITIQILEQTNNLFPKHLKSIKNPPQKLYLAGNPLLLQTPCIAVIGSRNCSENGKNLARQFTAELVQQGLTIVSGLASRN